MDLKLCPCAALGAFLVQMQSVMGTRVPEVWGGVPMGAYYISMSRDMADVRVPMCCMPRHPCPVNPKPW